MKSYGKAFRLIGGKLSGLKPLVILFLFFEALSFFSIIPARIFPAPSRIAKGIWELASYGMPPGYLLFGHFTSSLVRVFFGFTAALLAAFPLGVIIGRSEKIKKLINPLIEMVRPIPPLAWLPISVLWFGLGIISKSFLIFLGAFFPILSNTVLGVMSVDRAIIDGSLTLGAERRSLLLKVIVPASMPSVFTGMRVGLGIGWMTLVAAELTGVKSGYGLGYMIMTARDLQRIDLIFAGMVIIGLSGYLMDSGISLLEKKVLAWRMDDTAEDR